MIFILHILNFHKFFIIISSTFHDHSIKILENVTFSTSDMSARGTYLETSIAISIQTMFV